MAALDSFKVDRAPAALSATALALNALVDLINNIQGGTGIKVTVSEGRILIEATAAGPAPTDPRGGGSSASGTATAVTSDGTLLTAVAGTAGTAFPTTLKTSNGGANCVMNSVGFSMVTSGGGIANLAFANITHNISLQTYVVNQNGNVANALVFGSPSF